MFASPPLCHFRKTRTQYLSGRTENHRTLVGIVGFRAGMKHKTFRICTQHHSMSTCQPHNHLCNRFLPLQACSHTTHLPPRPSYSKCTLLPSIPPFCSDSPQYHLQDSLSITTLVGASRRFFRKRRFWLRSAD